MATSESLIVELESAFKSGASEKRLSTLRKVTDLFLDEADQLNEQQISVFDDVLMHLIERIEQQARVQLSATLAPVLQGPRKVIGALARDENIDVAGPVLAESTRLTDQDLIEISRSSGQAHLLKISSRASLAAPVTDVLIERGDAEVTRRLAGNSGARFSAGGYDELARRAETDVGLAEKLGIRLDMPINLLRQLLARATQAVRDRLMAVASPEAREMIQNALSAIAQAIGKESAGPRDFTAAEDLVAALNRAGKLNETVLANFATERKYEEMISTLALLSQSKSDLIESLIKNPSPEGVIVACKAAHLRWPTVVSILNARFAHHSIPDRDLIAARRSFDALSLAAAERTMRFMSVKSAAKTGALDEVPEVRPSIRRLRAASAGL